MYNKMKDALVSASMSEHHSKCSRTADGGKCDCHVSDAKRALLDLSVKSRIVNSCQVVMNRWSATDAIAGITNCNGFDFNFAGGEGVNAKNACMNAAKVLREAAQRFELLALEDCPYTASVHARINAIAVSGSTNLELTNALQAFIDDMEGRFGDIPEDCESYHKAMQLLNTDSTTPVML